MTAVKKRVLLIDDEPAFTRLLKLNLEKTGAYEVREEHQGVRGLTAVREFRPDIIFLDIVMPDVDGSTVLSQIRSSEDLKETKVVFLTAVLTKREANKNGGQIKSIPCLAKPVGTQAVVACIEKHVV